MNRSGPEPDRRCFLGWTSAAGAFLAAHECAEADQRRSDAAPAADSPRIRSLELQTAPPLAKMKEFYHSTLGLRVAEDKPDRLTIDAGQTRVIFRPADKDHGQPFYHFAFNIPENKLLAAHKWQSKRTTLLPIPERLRDPKFPDDVVHYRHWDAHSVFFFDPAGNVVEYIARHTLKNAAAGAFGSADILYASEIAFVVDDVTAGVAGLTESVGVGPYKSTSDEFAALGDELGLLLVMKRGRVISFDSPDKKAVTVYPTTATVRGDRKTTYKVPKFPYQVSVEV